MDSGLGSLLEVLKWGTRVEVAKGRKGRKNKEEGVKQQVARGQLGLHPEGDWLRHCGDTPQKCPSGLLGWGGGGELGHFSTDFHSPSLKAALGSGFCVWLASSPVLEKALSLAEKLQALEMRSMGLLERDLSCSRRWPRGGGWDGGGREIIITCYRSLPGLHVSGVSTILFWAHELPKQALTYSYV